MIGEDNRFLEHGGIDYFAILEALGYRRATFAWDEPRDRAEVWRTLGSVWSRRAKLRGASTITQQLAKNLYLSPDRNPLRKLKEGVTAYRLEAALSKRRLMELYLNVAEFGPNLWGAEAASEFYFQRPASQLSPSQAASLAGTLPFPLSSNPAYRTGPDALAARPHSPPDAGRSDRGAARGGRRVDPATAAGHRGDGGAG